MHRAACVEVRRQSVENDETAVRPTKKRYCKEVISVDRSDHHPLRVTIYQGLQTHCKRHRKTPHCHFPPAAARLLLVAAVASMS